MGICSEHQIPVKGCRLCSLHPRDVLPDYDRKKAEAEASGLITCQRCSFEHYAITHMCPLCYFVRPPDLICPRCHKRGCPAASDWGNYCESDNEGNVK